MLRNPTFLKSAGLPLGLNITISFTVLIFSSFFAGLIITPSSDPIDDILTGLIVGIFIHLGILLFFNRSPNLTSISWLWFIKMFFITVVGFAYEYSYRSIDPFLYFGLAKDDVSFGFGASNNSVSWIIKTLTSLFGISYQGTKVAFSFFGFLGTFLIYKSICIVSPSTNRKLAIWIVMVYPSILFWSSMIGKDAVVMLFLGFYMLCSALLISPDKKDIKTKVYLIGAMFLAIYWLGCIRVWLSYLLFIPSSILILWSLPKFFDRKKKAIILVFGTAFTFVSISKLWGIMSPLALVDLANRNRKNFSYGGSGIQYPPFEGILDVLLFLPVGMFSSLFRPLPWESSSSFSFIASLENLFLILMVGITFVKFRLHAANHKPLLWGLCCLLVLTIPYAFVSPFNLGAGFRFKVQFLPFLFIIIAASTIKDKTSTRDDN